MNKKVEDLVEAYIKKRDCLLNFNGQAEYHLRQWGKRSYNQNPFKKCTNTQIWKEFLELRNSTSMYNPALAAGREKIIDNPNECVRIREQYKYIRFEMYKRGILDAVYDRWDKDDKDILERIEKNNLTPIDWMPRHAEKVNDELNPFESLKRTILSSSLDYSKGKDHIWLYGIIVGWDDDIIKGFEEKYEWWTPEESVRLKTLHHNFNKASQGKLVTS